MMPLIRTAHERSPVPSASSRAAAPPPSDGLLPNSGILRTLITLLVLVAVTCVTHRGAAEPRALFSTPVASPDRTRFANVHWDDAGFIGRIGMQITDPTGKTLHEVQLPEIDPSPADLLWLSDEWVAAESLLGARGRGFLYVHAVTGKACLVEFVAGESDWEWDFTLCMTDPVSSAPVPSFCSGRSSVFPILLPDLPTTTSDYFRPEFPARLFNAAEAFAEFRHKSGFREMELIAGPDVAPDGQALAVVAFDGVPEAVCFSATTTVPQELFAGLQRHCLSDEVRQALDSLDPVELSARWSRAVPGEYVVDGVFDWLEGEPTTKTLVTARFEPPPPPPAPLAPPPVAEPTAVTSSEPTEKPAASPATQQASAASAKPKVEVTIRRASATGKRAVAASGKPVTKAGRRSRR